MVVKEKEVEKFKEINLFDFDDEFVVVFVIVLVVIVNVVFVVGGDGEF